MASSTRNPPMGVTTKSLVTSSVTKSIIPARIRAPEKNDVVFVFDDSIELKEYRQNGSLQYVARKRVFGYKILSACCVGNSIKPEPISLGGIDAILKPDPDEMNIDDSHSSTIIKSEPDGSHSGHTDRSGAVTQSGPPQILAVALEPGHLVFLFAYDDNSSGLVGWRRSSMRSILYSGGSLAGRSTKRMTVDSTSSLLAIAPHEGQVSLFCLKSMSQIHAELQSSSASSRQLNPVSEERTIAIKGKILQMEFLHASSGDLGTKDSLVTLVIIVSRNGVSRLHRYEWYRNTDIETFKEIGTGHLLGADEQIPLLLIPITIFSGFLLVCEKRAFLYGDTSHGCWQLPTPQNLNDDSINGVRDDSEEADSSPQERGSSHSNPIWTQWTRPVRRADWFRNSDAIYLCREDGLVKYLHIETQGRRPTISKCRVGKVNSNVDLAFACLDNGTEGTWHKNGKESEDIIAAGSSTGDGGLYSFKGRRNAIKQQTFPGWAPLLDLCTIPLGPIGALKSFDPNNYPHQVFALSGKGSRDGAFSELRFGTCASIEIVYELPEPTVLGFDIFTARSGFGDEQENMILLTGPEQTHLMDQSGADVSMKKYELNGASQTIAAGNCSDGMFIQITASSIRVVFMRWWDDAVIFEEHSDILAAYIDGFTSTALLCIREENRALLELRTFTWKQRWIEGADAINPEYFGTPLLLETDVTSLYWGSIGRRMIILAADREHFLHVFWGAFEGVLKEGLHTLSHKRIVFEDYAANPDDPNRGLCESIALLAWRKDADNLEPRFLALCGLRNGRYEAHVITLGDEGVLFGESEVRRVGTASVKIIPDTTSTREYQSEDCNCYTRALVLSGGVLYRVSYSPVLPLTSGALLTRIWLVDHDEPGRRYSNITAVATTQPDCWPVGEGEHYDQSDVRLICLEGNELLIAELGQSSEPQLLPRKQAVGGTPSGMMYSNSLRKLFVGFSKTVTRSSRGLQTRLHFPMLAIVDPYEDFSSTVLDHSESTSRCLVQNVGKSGERILGIHEWLAWRKYRSTFHGILIHTASYGQEAESAPTGRISFYGVRLTDSHTFRLEELCSVRHSAPVHALAVFDDTSIVHCVGTMLVKLDLVVGVDNTIPRCRMKQVGLFKLPSPGVSVSVEGNTIFVSTKAHSLLVFRWMGDRFVSICGDTIARQASFHRVLAKDALVYVACTNGTLVVLEAPGPLPPVNQSLPTCCEAPLPSAITRLLAGHLQPRCSITHEGGMTIGSSANGAIYEIRYGQIPIAK